MSIVTKYGKENYIANGMGIPAHDYIANTYNGDGNLTAVTYKIGGASGEVVAILEMTYDVSNNLLTVERTT
jgi:hypothetical protein